MSARRFRDPLAGLLLGVVLIATPHTAAAQSSQIAFEGLLTDLEDVPLEGEHMLHISIYPAASGGAALYESTETVLLERGRFVVYLGPDPGLFRDHDDLFVGVARGADPEMTPRMELAAVPWAISARFCDEAASVPGLATVATSGGFTDLAGVPTDLLDGDADTLGGLSCATGQVAQWMGSSWGCAANGTPDTLAGLGCTAGQIAAWDGATWGCADDLDTDVLGGLSCGLGDVAGWNGVSWSCQPNPDGDTLASLACATGEVTTWDGAAWICRAPWLDAGGNAVVPGTLSANSIRVTGTTRQVRADDNAGWTNYGAGYEETWARCGFGRPVLGVRLRQSPFSDQMIIEVECGP